MTALTRRAFLEKAAIGTVAAAPVSFAHRLQRPAPPNSKSAKETSRTVVTRYAIEGCATEWAYSSGKAYSDPFNDVDIDVVFTDPEGREQKVPAFWAGEH